MTIIESLEQRILFNNYFVATNGLDTNLGTEASPWKTLQKAADTAKAGDIVTVKSGTYNIGMNLYGKTGGTKDKPITFNAESNTIITHAATTGVNAGVAAINIENTGGYYIINGFTINSDGSMQKAGIRVAVSSNCQIVNNKVNKAFTGIFVSYSDNILIQNNICTNSTDQHGIYVSLDTNNCVVRGNTLSGNNWDGLHLNSQIGEPNNGVLVENNIIFNNNLSGMDIEGTTNGTFVNNLVYNNTKHGFTLHNQDQSNTPPCTNNVFINNTSAGNGMFGIQMANGGNTQNTLFNNVFIETSSLYGSIGISGSATGLKSDYNIVVDNFSQNLGVSKITLNQWRNNTGQDLHSIISSMQDTFLSSSDFHLKTNSSALDNGTITFNGYSAPILDLNSLDRPQGNSIDIGAYESHISRGDANEDGVVDTSDFSILAANFGLTDTKWTDGDFNRDNVVDTVDFNILAANFGTTPVNRLLVTSTTTIDNSDILD